MRNKKVINYQLSIISRQLLVKLFVLIFTVHCSVFPFHSYSQTGVGINTSGAAADPAAILDVSSTNTGILIPRMTDVQRDALKDPAAGLIIYNTTANEINFWNGTSLWQRVPGNSVYNSSASGSGPGGGTAINTNGAPPDASAMLDVTSTEKGLLLPRLSGTFTTTATGLIIYNTSTNNINYFDGSSWQAPCSQPITGSNKGSGASSGIVSITDKTTTVMQDNSAILDLSSTIRGLLIPRISSVQRNAINSPVQGLIIYNNDDKSIEYWSENKWYELEYFVPATPTYATGPTTVCANASGVAYSINPVAGATSYTWSVPASATITAQATTGATVTFGTAGTVIISVTAGNLCGTSTAQTKAVTVNDVPQGSLTANGPFCGSGAGQLTWTASAGTGTYTVVYNDGTANRTAPNITSGTPFTPFTSTVTSTTTYTLVSVTDANGCIRSNGFTGSSATITVNTVPAVISSVSGGGSQCGGTLTLTANGGANGIIYYQGTTSNNTVTNLGGSPKSGLGTGTHYFRSYNSTGGCWGAEGSAAITINTVPTTPGTPGSNTPQCASTGVTLSQTGSAPGGENWYWQGTNSAGTSTASNASSTYNASSTGTYYIRSQNTATLCWSAAAGVAITINPNQSISLYSGTQSPTICINTAITNIVFSVGGGGTGASLKSGSFPTGVNGSFSGSQYTISGTPSAAGSFTYTITTSGSCTTDQISGTITVQNVTATPVVSAICKGATTASGTSSEANGTAITVYKAGTTQVGTATVSGGAWTTGTLSPTITTGDVITAKATASGKCQSLASSPVTVTAGCPCTWNNLFTFTVTHTSTVPASSSIAPATKAITYNQVQTSISGTSKCWITQNLGSSKQADSQTDATELSAGWYWQYNRKKGYKHDGTTRTPNDTWDATQYTYTGWLTTTQDPCYLLLGPDWRMPTNQEWINVKTNGGWATLDDAWNSELKLHAAGSLNASGNLSKSGKEGYYWSSNTQYNNSNNGLDMEFLPAPYVSSNTSYIGETLRCVR